MQRFILARKIMYGALITILGLGIFSMARMAIAQNAVEKRFDQLDRNQDGKVTRDELPAAEMFKKLDLDENGEITKQEATKAILKGAMNDYVKPVPTVTGPTPAETPVRQGPQPILGGAHGLGTRIPDISFSDIDGRTFKLHDFPKNQLLVFAMTSTTCPISKKYVPTLVTLAKSSGSEITWILVNSTATDKPAEMREVKAGFEQSVIYVHDTKGELANHLGALTTTDTIILKGDKTVAYHGAIDDQYGFGYSIEAPRHNYLQDALNALKSGKRPLVTATDAPGCKLEHKSASNTQATVTYHQRISRIVQQHCLECHRDQGVAPFSLETYDDVVAHAGMIKEVLERGVMPPWFAKGTDDEHQTKNKHTPWANDRSLAASEKQDFLNWISQGKSLGNPADAPLPVQFNDGWLIGKPDAVYEFAKPVSIKATGIMPYQNILVETNLAEDKWVQAIEVQPGDRSVVHHVLVFVEGDEDPDDSGDDAASERGGFWAIYVPGNSTLVFEDGFAKRIPQGAKLKFQMHYTPNGKATTDKTRIGLIWSKQPPKHEVRVAGIVNARINIPPGADSHREEATLRLPVDAQIMGFLPHMHLRGKACKYEVTRVNGKTTTLLDIPRYDFNWQLLYRYFEPLSLHAGDTLRFTAWYDNSQNNPANPDPSKTVRWGAQTYDEMHLGYVEYFIPHAKPGETPTLRGRPRALADRGGTNLNQAFKKLDRNQDGFLVADELPVVLREKVMQLDTNNDAKISLEEAQKFK